MWDSILGFKVERLHFSRYNASNGDEKKAYELLFELQRRKDKLLSPTGMERSQLSGLCEGAGY